MREVANQSGQSAEKLNTLFEVLMNQAFEETLTAKWREAHMNELLVEMERQGRLLRTPETNQLTPA
jgi:type I restriction enzyme S subunit